MRRFMTIFTMLMLCGAFVFAQNRTITGKVVDATGNALANASVLLKGTQIGTTTDANGNYSLSVPSTGRTLVFSSVQMKPEEESIGSRSIINVTLSAGDSSLEEVVIVAYGTQKKTNLTGSIATVSTKELENKPFTSVDKALQGQIAGLQSVASSGQPGASQSILIRGVSSISASNAPLWVIDGVPVNSGDASRLQTTSNLLSTLNPNDIESVTVLKDAASQSIYGSRAANGVIIITTKSGKAGKTKFRFDTEAGQSSTAYVNKKYIPLNAADYFMITEEGYTNAGVAPASIATTLAGLGKGNGVDVSWYDSVQQKGTQQQYNLSMAGGNDRTTYFLSGGYFSQDGTVINSKFERTNGAFRLNHKATDRLTVNFNLSGGYVNQRAPLAGGAFGNPVLSSFFMLPSNRIHNADGTWNYNTSGGLHNVVALTEIDKRLLREMSMRGNLSGTYKILDNLTFKTSFSGDYNNLEEDQYNNPFHGDGKASNGRAFSYYTRYMNQVWTNTLNLQQNLTKNGDVSLNALVGYESQSSKAYFSSVQNQDFPPTLLLTYPAVGARPVTATATISDYTFVSQFASANLGYKDRYIVSGSFRRDGSSRFGANNRYGDFWSVGGSWNVDREEFMKNQEFVSQLKLRASYGVNGNAGIGNYDWWPLYGYGYNYNTQPGSAPSNVGDENLTWELNKPFNVGVDVSILKSRINFTADYYVRKSEDLLLNVPLSRTSGFASAKRNLGAMENKGLELTLNAVPIRSADFSWIVDFNFATNENKITSLPEGNDILDGLLIIREGESIQSFYIRKYAGVDPANGDPLWYTNGKGGATTNVYATAERSIIGNALPKYFGSFTNSINFRGFTVEAQLYYNFGNYVYDTWGSYYAGAGNGQTFNKVNRVLDRWQKPGDITDMPKYVAGGNKSFQNSSTFYLAKGDFIRLRNIQVGYKLPTAVLSKLNLTSAHFYVRGTNLWTWVKDKDLSFDPEQGTRSSTDLNVFIPKTVSVGLNLSF